MANSQSDKELGAKPHGSFWLISALALVWNAMGCLNYVSQMNPEAVADMPEIYRAAIESRPAWATTAFAVAVIGGLLGSLLLLLRKKISVLVLGISCLAALVAVIQFQNVAGLDAVGALIGGLVQIAVALFLIWYSKLAATKGWIG